MMRIEPELGEASDIDYGGINRCRGFLEYQCASEPRYCRSRSPALSLPDLSAMAVYHQILINRDLAHKDRALNEPSPTAGCGRTRAGRS